MLCQQQVSKFSESDTSIISGLISKTTDAYTEKSKMHCWLFVKAWLHYIIQSAFWYYQEVKMIMDDEKIVDLYLSRNEDYILCKEKNTTME